MSELFQCRVCLRRCVVAQFDQQAQQEGGEQAPSGSFFFFLFSTRYNFKSGPLVRMSNEGLEAAESHRLVMFVKKVSWSQSTRCGEWNLIAKSQT